MIKKTTLIFVCLLLETGCVQNKLIERKLFKEQEQISYNQKHVNEVLEKYLGDTLTPKDLSKIKLNKSIDYSYTMLDLELNQSYLYKYIGSEDGLHQFKILTDPMYVEETIFLNKHSQVMKSSIGYWYNKSCTFILDVCEKVRYQVNGVQHTEKVVTTFSNGAWISITYRKIENEFRLYSKTYTVYDKQGLPIYTKYFLRNKLLAEFARVL